tara:strand:+ start:137 stop:964 length:828 start_codon:yes stop_codon:yes gene_type:complete
MKITKAKLKQIIKEELENSLFSYGLENPMSVALPEEVAFHPAIVDKRAEHIRSRLNQELEKCKDKRKAEKDGSADELSDMDTGSDPRRPGQIGTGNIGRDLYDEKETLEKERSTLRREEGRIASLIKTQGTSQELKKEMDGVIDRINDLGKEIEKLGGEYAQRIRRAIKDQYGGRHYIEPDNCNLLFNSEYVDPDFTGKVNANESEYEMRWRINSERSDRRRSQLARRAKQDAVYRRGDARRLGRDDERDSQRRARLDRPLLSLADIRRRRGEQE